MPFSRLRATSEVILLVDSRKIGNGSGEPVPGLSPASNLTSPHLRARHGVRTRVVPLVEGNAGVVGLVDTGNLVL